jgi:hypothetical protein
VIWIKKNLLETKRNTGMAFSPATVGVAGIGVHMCNQSQAFSVILWWKTVVLNICLTQFKLQPFTRAVM